MGPVAAPRKDDELTGKTLMQTKRRPDCQVLVVGAGPSGLVLASELLARGISTRVIDKGDGVVLESRALGIHSRTLEVFDSLGLADQFLERGQVVRRFRMYTAGRTLVNLDLSLSGSRFNFILDVPQNETESLLRGRVGELGGTIEQEMELLGFWQDHDQVIASVKHGSGEIQTIAAGFVVGCDGAHSRVRHELGLEFTGEPYQDDWLLADVRLDWSRPEDEVHAFFRHHGPPLICFPMRDHRWRVVLPYAGDRNRRPPTLEEIQHLVVQRAPEPVVASDPSWLASFRCQLRSTHEYRRGRVMLAGDAVHIHSPAGGQGMNTGIMDAHNLAWKLALVASGRSPERLLDTYGEERARVAAQVLRLTHALVRLGIVKQPLQRALRDTVIPVLSRVTPIQRRAVRRMTHQHVAYRSSSLTRGRAWGRGGPQPGDSAPDIEVLGAAGPIRLHQVLRGGRHVLLGSGSEAPGLSAYRSLLEFVVGEFLSGRRRGVYLIRPDGYVAARGTSATLEYLGRVFGRSGPSKRRPSLQAIQQTEQRSFAAARTNRRFNS